MRIQDRIHGEQVLGPVKYLDEAGTLDINDNLVLSTGNAITIKLPSVAQARGQIYTIVKTAGTGTLTVDHSGDAIATGQTEADEVTTDVALANENDFITVMSTGLHWITMAIKR